MDSPNKATLNSISPKKHWLRRILRVALMVLTGILVIGMIGWMSLAVCYADLHSTAPRTILASIVAIASFGVVFLVRPRRRGLLIFAGMFVGVLAWFFSIRPSSSLDWATDVRVMPYAEINGDIVHLHNIRNFDYRSETDFTPAYYDRTFDLKRIQSIDFILSYWAGPAIAHAFLSFGFDDGQQVAISIETRKEKKEQYSAIEGFFRQYELIYVVADERDLIRLRTNHRGEEVYLYRAPAPPEKARAVFLDYLRVVNNLHEKPQFYNALTENCTTSLYAHLRCYPPYPPITPGVLLPGYSAQYAYEYGGLNYGVNSFDELQRRSRINDAAKQADRAADFSKRIRARLVKPVAPTTSGSSG